MFLIDPAIHMWMTFLVIAVAIVFYSMERVTIEVTSLAVIAILLIFFAIFPIQGAKTGEIIGSRELLSGFAEPALIAIIALLVVGQGLVQTGALDAPAQTLLRISGGRAGLVTLFSLVFVAVTSAFLNNTPVVVIFIPIMAALAEKLQRPTGAVMIPLSFVAILGGMTTLIGSSTNLLVSGAAEKAGLAAIGFFDFAIPGVVLASVGMIYSMFILPRIMPDRSDMAESFTGEDGKQFIAEIDVAPGSILDGEEPVAGMFKSLPEMTVRLIQRGERAILPPFDDLALRAGDVVIVAATRKALADLFSRHPVLIDGRAENAEALLIGEPSKEPTAQRIMAEVVVAPASRLDGRTLALSGFRAQTGCIVLGIQRRSRMIRASMNEIRLEAGDVLLVTGRRNDVNRLRDNKDVLLLEWSTRELPRRAMANRALLIFAAVVGSAASGILPIEIAALSGAGAMIIAGALNVRQASRAVDRRVVLLVAAALAMGTALQATGGAAFVAHGLVGALSDQPAPFILSAFFLLVAALTNILSNNATAVLFTPIAVGIANELGMDPLPFIYAVIFGANCSFATPIAYQTNLLVMGPGHYQFIDFVRAGTPLILLLWLVFSFFMPFYFDIG